LAGASASLSISTLAVDRAAGRFRGWCRFREHTARVCANYLFNLGWF